MKKRVSDFSEHLKFVLPLMVILLPGIVFANVENVHVKSGELINKEISINPGFAVMFQFPDEATALTLADQTSFACDKMPTDPARVLCKPLTQSPFSTNLMVTTTTNEFNLVLSVDPSAAKHPFKYVFYTGSVPAVFKSVIEKSSLPSSSSQNLIGMILDHYSSKPCRLDGESLAAEFRCLNRIEIGADQYLRFAIKGKGSMVKVIKITINSESLGGLTGLAVRDEGSSDVEYSLTDTPAGGGEMIGVLRIPQSEVKENKRNCLVVMTDRGRQGDIRIYGL